LAYKLFIYCLLIKGLIKIGIRYQVLSRELTIQDLPCITKPDSNYPFRRAIASPLDSIALVC